MGIFVVDDQPEAATWHLIEIAFEDIDERDRAFEAIEKLLGEMGQIGTLSARTELQMEPSKSETTVGSLSDALVCAKYIGLDRARFVLCSLLQSGDLSIEAFRGALAKRKAYVKKRAKGGVQQ